MPHVANLFRSAFIFSTTILAVSSQATLLRYTLHTTGSGTIGGQNFSGLVRISTIADTANVSVVATNQTQLNGLTVTAEIPNFGTATFTQTIVLNAFKNGGTFGARVGFGNSTANASLLYSAASSYSTYDLTQTRATTNGTAIWGGTHATTLGAFKFNTTFAGFYTAEAVPEPASMIALGVGAFGLFRRRARS